MSKVDHHAGDVGGVAVRGLRKRYDDTEVLRGVDLDIRAGEVHALLGANGAGKSTLLGCLSGAVVPDEGTFTIGGREYHAVSPAAALIAGIATIYQHFQLIGPLSVSDNVFLGSEIRNRSGRVDHGRQRHKTAELLGLLGSELPPSRAVTALSPGEMQLVEIARALRHQRKVLILDEPTAALGDRESGLLIELVRRLASAGMAIVYVTHRLKEVAVVADVVTVLRDGRRLWTKPAKELSHHDLVKAIAPQTSATQSARTIQSDVVAEFDDYRGSWMGPLTMAVHASEIVGVFGLLGSGRTDLLESMVGVRRGSGGLRVCGAALDGESVGATRRAGLALVPSDRQGEALFGRMSALDNVLMPHLNAGRGVFRRKRKERATFMRVAGDVGLAPLKHSLSVEHFSGGNAQKLVIARWLLDQRLRLLLVDEPTQGVDVAARGDLYRLLREYAQGTGKAIVFATSDPEEAVQLGDRIVVLEHGRVAGVVPGSVGETKLLAMAHGSGAHESREQ